MNRDLKKFCFWVLPVVVLTGTLHWVNWKADNPTPTVRDLAVRNRFVQAKDAVLILDNPVVEGRESEDHKLSLQERQLIADHLWIASTPSGVPSRFTPRAIFVWGSGECFVLDFSRADYYQSDRLEIHNIKLHPATSYYLRRWLEEHPAIEKQIGFR